MKKITLIFMLIALTLTGLRSSEIVDRVEPLFWWTGMQNPELQLMLFGENISKARISINYKDVKIARTELTDNPDFVFLYLNIGKKAKPGKMNIVIRQGRKTIRYPYELKQREAGAAQRPTFTEADAVYLLMPDRFANGNTANDSVQGYVQGVDRSDLAKRHGGDIEGIISKLPYMADLGITALWTTPLFDNNDVRFSYHHYGCSDYYKIDPRFGANEDYRRLADEARKNGIKLIMDIVPNHCSSAHWWMKNKPAKNWFNEWPQFTNSNYRMMAWTDPHAAQSDLKRLTHGWFAPNMPDFNLQNKLLFDYLTQVYIFWIEYAGIAGLRVDTYPYNDIKTAASFIQTIRKEYPAMNIVGECWMNTSQEIAYYQSGNNNKDGFDSRMQSVMDFPLGVVFQQAFNEKEGWNSGMARFYMHFALDFAYPNTNLLMNFLDNHDIDRYSEVVGRNVKRYKMALAMLMTVRGYPQIYYGSEIMLEGIRGSFEGHRFTIPGAWPGDKRNAFTAAGRTAEENEVFDYMKFLLNYRKNNPVLHQGKMKHFIPNDGIYVYFRYNEQKTVMVVVNNNDESKQLDLSRFAEMYGTRLTAADIQTAEITPLNKTMSLAARTVRIFEIH